MVEIRDDDAEEQLHPLPAGRYLLLDQIGSGGHAMVMQGWDRALRRWVACKLSVDRKQLSAAVLGAAGVSESKRELLLAGAAARKLYTPLREARLLAQVDHPNVLEVIDVGLHEVGVIGLVLPYMEGGTLEDRELGGPWQAVLDIALQIGRGLEAIHAAGILHRDLKPDNILFDRGGRPHVADLGLGCLVDDPDAMKDRVGTENYMAPSVITSGHRDARDDLYSYCMIVYQMFYGRSPFATMADRARGRVLKSTREHQPPRALDKILMRGLASDADDRWPDMHTLLRAMQAVHGHADQRWRWAVAAGSVALAASVAIGVVVTAQPAQADSCEDLTRELDPIWDRELQAELFGAFGTRKPGDALQSWAGRWVLVRTQACEAAKRGGHPTGPSPCSAKLRERFDATLHAFRTPHLRRGLNGASVIAQLPAPEHCVDHPDDSTWGEGGLLDLSHLDVEVGALVGLGDLEPARARQLDYMKLALELRSEYGITRAIFWRGEIRRLSGELDGATWDFEHVYAQAQALGVPVVGAEAMMKLTAIAGARGDLSGADACALAARGVFAAHQPERVAELLQTQGLALLSGPASTRARAVGLLNHAVELREEQLREHGGTHELLSQAHESYAQGLLAVHRASEALEYLDLALRVHQDEYGHGTWRIRGILRQKFLALVELGDLSEAKPVWWTLLGHDYERADWQAYVEDALWLGETYEIAGVPQEGIVPLTLGREIAVAQDLSTEISRFDIALIDSIED